MFTALRQMGGARFSTDVCAPYQSRAKELLFENSQIDDETLDHILERIEALERFSYSAGGAIVSDDGCAPKKLIKSLAAYAGHSLENLILEFDMDSFGADDDEVSIMISFECQLIVRSRRRSEISLFATSRS